MIPYCGRLDVILLTLDRRIVTTPHLHALLYEHKVGAFFISGRRRKETPPPWLIFRTVVKHWEELKRVAATEKRPFSKLVKLHGRITNVGWMASDKRTSAT